MTRRSARSVAQRTRWSSTSRRCRCRYCCHRASSGAATRMVPCGAPPGSDRSWHTGRHPPSARLDDSASNRSWDAGILRGVDRMQRHACHLRARSNRQLVHRSRRREENGREWKRRERSYPIGPPSKRHQKPPWQTCRTQTLWRSTASRQPPT